MPAYKPEECDLLLFEIIDTGDLDAALDLYEPEATFVVSPDLVVKGHSAIREVLQGMIAAESKGKLESVTVVSSADDSIAFTRAKGSSTSLDLNGKPITNHFHSIEVVRKQSDGSWRIIIDDPGGLGLDLE